MPTQTEMKAALQAYIDGFDAGDADAIMALFATDAVIEDPVGSPLKSRAEFEAFIRQGVKFGARLTLAAPIRGSHGFPAGYGRMSRTTPWSGSGTCSTVTCC